MQHGERLKTATTALKESRVHARAQLQCLPQSCRALTHADSAYRVEITAPLEQALERIERSYDA